MNKINQKEVFRLFNYKNGLLIRRVFVDGGGAKGVAVGSLAGKGYLSVYIDGHPFRVHRLIFLYHYGYLPKMVDHIDGDKLNNKIENLRGCTNSENLMNAKLSKSNTSGIKGVSLNKKIGKWCASIRVNYKRLHIGSYDDINDAAEAVRIKRIELHGEFANHG